MMLPEEFQNRMRELLGAEYDAFIRSYEQPRLRGLRVNTRRITPERFAGIAPFSVERIPFVPNGFYYREPAQPAAHPYYAAGLYYLQEPSAMIPASLLPVRPGDRVLDLCAAPGGKATELAARLAGSGLLVANDISLPRARALLRNLELFGTENAFVTNETPQRLCEAFPAYFDSILVDAPCSGKGMFRKDEEAAAAWSPAKVRNLAAQQKTILEQAWQMLRPGGFLLYSTCTFAPEEDEENAAWLLQNCAGAVSVRLPDREGFDRGRPAWGGNDPRMEDCIRIWPHRTAGEGHFAALFRKDGPEDAGETPPRGGSGKKKKRPVEDRKRPDREQAEQMREALGSAAPDRPEVRGERAFVSPELPGTVRGLQFLRSGLYVGDWKKNRFEPSQPFALTLPADAFPRVCSLAADDPLLADYLRGASFRTEIPGEDGWTLVCADGWPVGWGKRTKDTIKNRYPASWRRP